MVALFSSGVITNAAFADSDDDQHDGKVNKKNRVWTGDGPPLPKLGKVGDLYINSSDPENPILWKKISKNNWDELGNFQGDPGPAGNDGQDGADGLSCWDTNQNGIGDPAEDVNGDSNYDTLDCKGMKGDIGPQGPPGTSGSATPQLRICNAEPLWFTQSASPSLWLNIFPEFPLAEAAMRIDEYVRNFGFRVDFSFPSGPVTDNTFQTIRGGDILATPNTSANPSICYEYEETTLRGPIISQSGPSINQLWTANTLDAAIMNLDRTGAVASTQTLVNGFTTRISVSPANANELDSIVEKSITIRPNNIGISPSPLPSITPTATVPAQQTLFSNRFTFEINSLVIQDVTQVIPGDFITNTDATTNPDGTTTLVPDGKVYEKWTVISARHTTDKPLVTLFAQYDQGTMPPVDFSLTYLNSGLAAGLTISCTGMLSSYGQIEQDGQGVAKETITLQPTSCTFS